jgi:hypothetical protein
MPVSEGTPMKTRNTILRNVVVALAVLLAAVAAKGQTVVFDDNDNVIQILNLPVLDQAGNETVYDVLSENSLLHDGGDRGSKMARPFHVFLTYSLSSGMTMRLLR